MTDSAPDVVVAGAGIIGLISALCLSRAGYNVAVIAKNLPGDKTTEWASPWAGAAIMPQPTDNERDIRMQKASFRLWGELARLGPHTGVQQVKATEYWDDRLQPTIPPWYSTHLPNFRTLEPSELAPGTTSGNTFTALTIDPDITLPWLRHHLESTHRVQFHHHHILSLPHLRHSHPTATILNATGLGARSLANDSAVHPIRGQTLLISTTTAPAKPSLRALAGQIHFRRGHEYTYTIPRLRSPDSLVLGGVEQPENNNVEPEEDVRRDVLGRVGVMTRGALEGVELAEVQLGDVVGFRPGRAGGYRVQAEGAVVHAYGFGGQGYRYSFGAGEEVVRLVGEVGGVVGGRPRL